MTEHEQYPNVYLLTYLEALEADLQIINQKIEELEKVEMQNRKQLGILEAMAGVLGAKRLSADEQAGRKELPGIIRKLETEKDQLIQHRRLMRDAIAKERATANNER